MSTSTDLALQNYESLTKAIVGPKSIIGRQAQNIKAQFDNFGLTNEQLGEALTKLYIDATIAFNKDALGHSIALVKIDTDIELKEAQTKLVERQEQGYSDNLLVKTLEHQSSVASYAINKSGLANESLNKENGILERMYKTENTLLKIATGEEQPEPVQIPIAPTGVNATAGAVGEVTIAWNNVSEAKKYKVYRYSLTGDTYAYTNSPSYADTGLSVGEVYTYFVSAISEDGTESRLSLPVMYGA